MEIDKRIDEENNSNVAPIGEFFEVKLPESLLDYKEHAPHHWELPPPDGRECLGICKHCGSKGTFLNFPESEEREFQIKGKNRPKRRTIEEKLPEIESINMQELTRGLGISIEEDL